MCFQLCCPTPFWLLYPLLPHRLPRRALPLLAYVAIQRQIELSLSLR